MTAPSDFYNGMIGCINIARANAAAEGKSIRSFGKLVWERKTEDIYDGKTLKINEGMKIETTKEFKYLG